MWEGTHLNCLLSFNSAIDLLLIDRCSQGCEIPPRRGVGLARKIGADIATQLICEGIVTDPWIYTTDADVCLPADYFDAIGERERRGAVLFPFRHKADAGSMDAAMLYELSLHYYVRALRWSGSPYAYHSIGSTLAVHFESYAMVRGFPRRAAGEDFYLLNKVAKVADIFSLPIPDIEIEARESNRTPFGTGKNLASIKSLQAPLDQYGYYHPEIFHLLRLWLARMNTVWIDRPETLAGYVSVGCTSEESGAMHGCLSALKIPQAVAKGLQQYRSAQSFGRFLHGWFDALKTLKFIHFMKDHAYPSVNLREMLAAPFMNIGGADLLDDLPRDVSRAHLHDVLQEIIERVRLSA
tara:strand:- start:40 stop:1098 length:1059 start_codon:yes stop_codon:yes gene_type:complete